LPAENNGKIIFIVGLPGSGKSHLIEKEYESDDYKYYHDFNAGAPELKFKSSNHFNELVEQLRASLNVVVADVSLCREEFRWGAIRALKDKNLVPNQEWLFFENNPEKCIANVKQDSRRPNYQKRVEGINDLTAAYVIPDGVIPLTIWSK